MSQPNLPSHWKLIPLGELSNIQSGGTPSREKPEFYGGQIKWVKTLDLNEGIVTETEETINDLGFQSIRGKLRPVNTVMVAMYGGAGTVGKSGVLGVPATTNQAVCCIEPNLDKFDSFYLLYHLIYLRPTWMREAIGTRKDPNISKGIIENTKVPLPPLPEQRAIAHTLLTIQKAKEARQRELELERERKAALMQYLFTHGTCNEPSKKTKIGEIPQSWRIVMLGDLCLKGLGIIQTGPFGSQLHASDYESAGIPVVNPTHLRFNSIVDDAIPRISREKADCLSKHYLIEGDILISRRGDFSRYSYISQKYSGWFCGTGCLLIRLTHPEVDNYFLSILFSTEVIQNYLKLNAVGSIMPNLNTRILQDVPLTLPKIEQQREIAEVLRSCDRKITALEQEAAFLDELFRAMLEELMTGRLSALPLVEEKALH